MIQINVEARCQARTQKGTQCTKEAIKYEGPVCRNDGETELFVELVNCVQIIKRWRPEATLQSGTVMPGREVEDRRIMLGIPDYGFVCKLHSKEEYAARAKKSFANHGKFRG